MTRAESADLEGAKREKAISKVKVLRAIAADQQGKPEGETAAALAAQIVEKYGLADEELGEDVVIERAVAPAGREVWRYVLLMVIARHYGCDVDGMDVVGPVREVAWARKAYDDVAGLVERAHAAHVADEARRESDLGQLLLGAGRWSDFSRAYNDPDRARRVRESFGVTAAAVLQKRLRREATMMRRVDFIVAGSLRRARAEIRGGQVEDVEAVLVKYEGARADEEVVIPRHTHFPRAEMLIERMPWPPMGVPR